MIKGQLTDDEIFNLESKIACPRLCDEDEQIKILTDKGFTDIKIVDMTDKFLAFTESRVKIWDENKQNNIDKQGEEVAKGWSTFIHTMLQLFKGGNLRGCHIFAVKK